MKTLYTNANVLTMANGERMEKKDILVEDRKIVSVGNGSASDADRVVDCRGLYAVPGFIEAHMHLLNDDQEALNLYVAHGITSIRNMFGNEEGALGDRPRDTFKMKQDIEEGRMFGPTLVNTSRIFDGYEPIYEASRIVTTKENLEYFLEEALREGAEQIKVYEYLDPDIFEHMCDWADAHNLKVVGHNSQRIPKPQFLARIFSVEHGLNFSLEEFHHLIESNAYWIPTVIVAHRYQELMDKRYKQFLNKDDLRYVTRSLGSSWNMYANMFYLMKDDSTFKNMKYKEDIEKVKRYYRAGKEVAVGTDYPNPFIYPGISWHEEIAILKKSGLTNYQLLRAATVMGSKVLQMEDRKGTLEPGKDADIVFLKNNPLKNFRNLKKIEKVVLRGMTLEKKDLEELKRKSIRNQDYV